MLNFEDIDIPDFSKWVGDLGIGKGTGAVTVIDLSMVAQEVLPYVCGVIGRALLELREHAAAERRFQAPWVIVLEEAHTRSLPPSKHGSAGCWPMAPLRCPN